MRIHTGIGAALAAVLLVTLPPAALAAPATPTQPGDGSEAGQQRSDEAEEALDAARELFRAKPPQAGAMRRSQTSVAESGAAEHPTAVLRELAARVGDLEPADRRDARRILARPTNGVDDAQLGVGYDGAQTANTCDAPGGEDLDVCVHWVTEDSPHAPPARLAPSGLPAWVESTQDVLEEVWGTIVDDLGYAEPVDDSSMPDHGPDGRPDVYLAELHDLSVPVYGYCVPEVSDPEPRRVPGYCVIDNDFVGYSGRPLADLKVTAAHEFFHLVQFAYTNQMDYWVAEGTAAWIEDEVYDDIDDNLQYLARSALSVSQAPLDFIDPDDFNWAYGSWIWWRFLTEYLGSPGKPDTDVVRQVWQRLAADGSPESSLQALRRVLAQRKTSFEQVFGDFGAVNRIAASWYDEGAKYRGFVGAPSRDHVVTKARPTVEAWRLRPPADRPRALTALRLSHLSTDHVILRPGRGLAGRWRLQVALDLPPRFRGSQANVMIHLRDGRVRWQGVRLNRKGNVRFAVPFNKRRVAGVVLSLSNASTRSRDCGRQLHTSPFSCGGTPLDDNLPFRYRVRATR